MSTAAGVRALARDVARSTRGHDLALYAAGVTFYAAIGFVPLLLLSLYLAGLLAGETTVQGLAEALARLLPNDLGAEDAARSLAGAGTSLSPVDALVSLVPATVYGEGLVRAFDRLSDAGEAGRRSLRGRLGSLLLVVTTPFLLLLGLRATQALTRVLGGGLGDQLLGVYLAFLVGWVSTSLLLMVTYRGIAPDACCLRALLWGAFSTGSFVSGMSLGFVLFLSLGVDLGGAYGGSTALATGAVALGWLLLLHAVVLVGYVLTLRLEARGGHPLAVPHGPRLVKDAA